MDAGVAVVLRLSLLVLADGCRVESLLPPRAGGGGAGGLARLAARGLRASAGCSRGSVVLHLWPRWLDRGRGRGERMERSIQGEMGVLRGHETQQQQH